MYALEQSAVDSAEAAAAAAASGKAKAAPRPEDGEELEAPMASLPRGMEKEVYSAAHRGKIAVKSHLDSAAHREALKRVQKLRLKQKHSA